MNMKAFFPPFDLAFQLLTCNFQPQKILAGEWGNCPYQLNPYFILYAFDKYYYQKH